MITGRRITFSRAARIRSGIWCSGIPTTTRIPKISSKINNGTATYTDSRSARMLEEM